MPTLDQLYQNHRFEAPLQRPPHLSTQSGGAPNAPRRLHMRLLPVAGSVHPLVPPTNFWSYEGSVPGPTVVVPASDQTVRATFDNQLFDGAGSPATMPLQSVMDDTTPADLGMNQPGSNGFTPNPLLTGLKAWTTVHLHGAPTEADSDGWPESIEPAGVRTERCYEFPQEVYAVRDGSGQLQQFDGGRAPTYWYHDHAMGVTRFNVYAGLAGAWLVRDPVEGALGLPTGSREHVLVIQDRNFETDTGLPDGNLSGPLLHKNTGGVMEAFGPATLVNGVLWPQLSVPRRLARLRVVNGSNARVFRLHFMGRRAAQTDPQPLPPQFVQQIGTDGGLLGAAIDLDLVPDGIPGAPLPGSHSLTLAPGERADLLVDFGGLAQAGWQAIELYNSAPAPFNSDSEQLASLAAIYTPDPAGFRPYPAVMRFDIKGGAAVPTSIQSMPLLGASFKRLQHTDLPLSHEHSLVAMREENGTLFMHELLPVDEADAMGMNMHAMAGAGGICLTLPQEHRHDGSIGDVTYVTVAKGFSDTNTIFIARDSWHVWRVLNLSPDTHPFHMHLVQFQGLSRVAYRAAASQPMAHSAFTFTIKDAPSDLAPSERGWKDTLRANPGQRETIDNEDCIKSAEMLTVAAQFTRHCGQYVYHCHILEHEDQDMMRHFVVMPKELMGSMKHMHP